MRERCEHVESKCRTSDDWGADRRPRDGPHALPGAHTNNVAQELLPDTDGCTTEAEQGIFLKGALLVGGVVPYREHCTR